MKKTIIILFSLGLFGLFALARPALAEERMCCPRGYNDGFWSCPVTTDRSANCCRHTGIFGKFTPFSYQISPKIPCDSSNDTAVSPIDSPLTQNDLNKLNPLLLFSTKESQFYRGDEFVLGMFINQALKFIFPLAGLILFVMIVWGGFEMLSSATNKKGLDAGKQRVVSALIGFLLLFSSYWIIQIIEHITQVNILGQ